MTVLAGTDKRRRAGPAPPDFGRQPWPHSATTAPMAPEGVAEPYDRQVEDMEPPDATRTRWLELPVTLAPYVRLGMRYYDGERQLIFRIIRELGEPEGYAEAIGTTEPMRELAETILDLCNFLDSFAYGVVPQPHSERG
jgi:hypothetical protein